MFFKRRLDKIIAFTSIIAICVAGLYLLEDVNFFGKEISYDKPFEIIARITKSNEDVRLKRQDEFSWQTANKNLGVKDQDKIFTGENSNAEITFNDKTKLNVDANSLVVIERTDKRVVLDMKFGTFTGTLGKNTKLTIISNGVKKEVVGIDKKSMLTVNVTPQGKTKVTVLKGAIGFKPISKKSNIITKNNSVELNDSGKIIAREKYEVLLKSPQNRVKFWENKNRSVKFSWYKENALDYYYFELSITPDFANPIIKKRISKTSFLIKQLPVDKKLYWRVHGNSTIKSGLVIQYRAFLIKENTPPVQQMPLDQKEILSEIEKVKFLWSDKTNGDKYQIQIFSKDNSNEPIIDEIVKDRNINFEIKEGDYLWRVSTVDRYRPQQKWSPLFKFRQTVIKPEEEIVDISPEPVLLPAEELIPTTVEKAPELELTASNITSSPTPKEKPIKISRTVAQVKELQDKEPLLKVEKPKKRNIEKTVQELPKPTTTILPKPYRIFKNHLNLELTNYTSLNLYDKEIATGYDLRAENKLSNSLTSSWKHTINKKWSSIAKLQLGYYSIEHSAISNISTTSILTKSLTGGGTYTKGRLHFSGLLGYTEKPFVTGSVLGLKLESLSFVKIDSRLTIDMIESRRFRLELLINLGLFVALEKMGVYAIDPSFHYRAGINAVKRLSGRTELFIGSSYSKFQASTDLLTHDDTRIETKAGIIIGF